MSVYVASEPSPNKNVAPIALGALDGRSQGGKIAITEFKGREPNAFNLLRIRIFVKWKVVTTLLNEDALRFIAVRVKEESVESK